MIYKLVKDQITNEISLINKITEGKMLSIPFAPDNTDYQEYLAWLAEGNTPEEA